MSLGLDRSQSRRDTALFLLCVGLSAAALFAPPRITDRVAQEIRGTVLVPLLWLQTRSEESKSLRAVNRQISLERDSAVNAAQFLPALRAENDRLRQLLGLSQRLGRGYAAAEVLHQSVPTDGRTLILGAGSDNGVREFQPVVAPEGLIGVVLSVDRKRSVAMSWADPEFRVSGFTEDGSVFGIVAPASQTSGGEMLLQLRGVAYRDTVPPGTLVLSSGLGGVFPQGIPIGTVLGLAREETGWERAYLLRPAANPEIVSHVLILQTNPEGGVGNAFRGDSTR